MAGGFRNLMWYVGVVEDRYDASNDGRVKIRAFGIHTEDKESLPTADLPWAIVLDGSYGAAQKIPDVGDWVFGFFMDGDDAQHPMVMGRVPGISLQLPPEAGAPKEANYVPVESLSKFGKPPLHRHLGGEGAEQGQAPLQSAAKKDYIQSGDDEFFWSEPSIITPEKDLDNTVFTSKNDSNYVVLSDSDDGDGTYILISHSSGSAIQIDAFGNILVKSFGDTYNSSEGLTMNRTDKSNHTNVGEDWTLRVERGCGKVWINGDLDIECENFNVTARGSANINAAVATNISGGKVGVFATSDDVNLAANANIKMKAGTPLNFGGIYGQALFGDVWLDSAQMSLTSSTYTKIYSQGLPSASLRVLPYPDVSHLGIDIDSKTSIRMNSKLTMSISSLAALGIDSVGALGIKSGATMDLHATGQLGVGAGAILNMDGSLVLIGNGTASATAGLATGAVTTVKAPQLAQSTTALSPLQFSVQEIAAVVTLGDIPGSRACITTKTPPSPQQSVSTTTDDTADGDSLLKTLINKITAI